MGFHDIMFDMVSHHLDDSFWRELRLNYMRSKSFSISRLLYLFV